MHPTEVSITRNEDENRRAALGDLLDQRDSAVLGLLSQAGHNKLVAEGVPENGRHAFRGHANDRGLQLKASGPLSACQVIEVHELDGKQLAPHRQYRHVRLHFLLHLRRATSCLLLALPLLYRALRCEHNVARCLDRQVATNLGPDEFATVCEHPCQGAAPRGEEDKVGLLVLDHAVLQVLAVSVCHAVGMVAKLLTLDEPSLNDLLLCLAREDHLRANLDRQVLAVADLHPLAACREHPGHGGAPLGNDDGIGVLILEHEV
mmetsp:Transcript_135124/g.337107  ORF Transcript_135124/g.337107 Transcript_135124/m.337107 type:complete len:262 (+) Transcript_135124:711-1496(+)